MSHLRMVTNARRQYIYEAVSAERERQEFDNHCLATLMGEEGCSCFWPVPDESRLDILMATVADIAKAIQDGLEDEIVAASIVQAAAICFRWLEALSAQEEER